MSLFLRCLKCGGRGRVCSLAVMRFKARCEHCGHGAACHTGRRRFWAPGLIVFVIVALLAGSLAFFANPH